MALFDDLYQDRIGGASIGDVFAIGSDDILSLQVKSAGGIKKDSNELAVEYSATGGLTVSTAGLAIKCKTGGGASVSADGLAISGAAVNNFQTMNCPAGTDPVASISTDTLNLAVTFGLTITGNSATKTITFSVKQQAHEANASTAHAITDPGDAPASVDALRDDLVANTIPSIETALNALGTKINSILTKLETAEILASA